MSTHPTDVNLTASDNAVTLHIPTEDAMTESLTGVHRLLLDLLDRVTRLERRLAAQGDAQSDRIESLAHDIHYIQTAVAAWSHHHDEAAAKWDADIESRLSHLESRIRRDSSIHYT